MDNKTGVIVYGSGALVALWLASTIVGALNNIPLVRLGTAGDWGNAQASAQGGRAAYRPVRSGAAVAAQAWAGSRRQPPWSGMAGNVAIRQPLRLAARRGGPLGRPLALRALRRACPPTSCEPSLVHLLISPFPTLSLLLQLPKLFELVGLGYSAWFTYRWGACAPAGQLHCCTARAPSWLSRNTWKPL